MGKGVRKNISVPGILALALRLRTLELKHRTVSSLVVALVCYDLRSGARHTITRAIGRESQPVQDAVDAEIVARYRPCQERNGLLVETIRRLSGIRSFARQGKAAPVLPLSTVPARVMLPAAIWPLADLRWTKLGYPSFSAYVTGLIRYDLLLGGPHKLDGSYTSRKVQTVLNEMTRAACEQGNRRKLFLDHLIEQAHHGPLAENELERAKAKIAQELLRRVRKPTAVT